MKTLSRPQTDLSGSENYSGMIDIHGLNVAIITGFNSSKISKRQRINK